MYLSEATKEYEEALRKLDEEDFAEYERIKQMREDKLEIEFKDNIGRTFVLQNLRFKDVGFFSECEWAFRPGVNVLLGRNGYGKSLILRTLAALLQRDDERSQDLLKNSNSAIELTISRDGKDKLIRRTSERFTDSVGKIPLLAIPDSRYLDRSQMKIGPSGESYDNLRDHGAYHFLHQLPYGGVIQSLLHEICLDYWEHGRNLKLPVIRFLEDAIGRLAGDRFEFSSIGRIGREQFGIEILTEGTENPMPIHYASQGTLSVFMLFGLTRSFLKSVYGESDTVNEQPAIVIIDEMDAHLHPKWQQRVIHLLRELFPHVQFIICAQNPAMVAGCLEHEVAVLRMSNKKFRIQQLDRDFVGATPRELYSDLFDIEEPDDSLLQHPEWKPLESDTMERLRQLDKKADEGSLNGKESAERHYMIRETRVRRKVSDASDNREDEEQKVLQLEAEIDRLRARISKLDPGKADKDGEVLE
ncbi:MAG: AAA family ATPase [FCB group bacterium]|nr:AAA family ATPase [FCB group bacterium]